MVIFGVVRARIDKDELREKLHSHESYLREMQPEKWKKIPEEFQRRFQTAYYLQTNHFSEKGDVIRFAAEWDMIEPYPFRGNVVYRAETGKGVVRLKHLENPWLISIDGDWEVAPRISRVLFDKLGQLSRVEIPSDILKDVLKTDSRLELKMKWKGIEVGIDGSLEGPLPKATGTRHDFDSRGAPCFARFESKDLGHVISISCTQGYITSRSVAVDDLVSYFESKILPGLPRPI
jgi:hypothetical protein